MYIYIYIYVYIIITITIVVIIRCGRRSLEDILRRHVPDDAEGCGPSRIVGIIVSIVINIDIIIIIINAIIIVISINNHIIISIIVTNCSESGPKP